MSDKAIHSYSLDRNTFIRVIEIAEKYYGMDAFYFTDQELNPTTMQGKEFSPSDYQTIYSHHTFEEQKAIFFSSESASKYVEPIPLDQGILLYYVLIAIEHALILQEDRYKFYEEELYDTDCYYENNLRSDLLRLYIFIKELPYKRGAKNETILTINKGFSKWQKRISLDNFDNWIFRSALLKYCEDHLWNIHSLEEAKTELKQLTRVGRSLDNPNIYPIIYGTYTMFKDFAQDKDYLNAFIVALASKWSVDEPIVISTADAESLKKYFAAHAKALLDKGVKIEQVNGIKTLFTVSPADGSYKVNFGEEEFMNYFKAFLRPQLVEMLF